MYRFFQQRYPDFPEVRFLLLLELSGDFMLICKRIEPIQNELMMHERVGLETESTNFIRNLGFCINNENSSVTPLYAGINILHGILKDYNFREACKPEHQNDMVI